MTTNDGIERRGDGWRITVATGRDPITGQYGRIREQVSGTKTGARRRRDELRVQVAHGTVSADGREPLATYLERWITHRQKLGKVRPRTAAVYRGYIAREVSPAIGGMRLRDVRPTHVQAVIDAATDRLAPRSVLQVHRILHAAFRWAVMTRLISVNPSDGVTPPDTTEPPTLTTPAPADVARLLEAISPDYRAPLMVAAGTGARRGEVLALRWKDVDLDAERPSIRITGTLQRADGALVVLPPKTPRSRREIPLSVSLATCLRQVRVDQVERRLLAGPAWNDGDLVFDAGDGRPVGPEQFGKAFRKARDAAGLQGVRLHDLRHAAASMLIKAGTSAKVVSDLMGHSTVAFTLQSYVHPDKSQAEAAVDMVERLLGG